LVVGRFHTPIRFNPTFRRHKFITNHISSAERTTQPLSTLAGILKKRGDGAHFQYIFSANDGNCQLVRRIVIGQHHFLKRQQLLFQFCLYLSMPVVRVFKWIYTYPIVDKMNGFGVEIVQKRMGVLFLSLMRGQNTAPPFLILCVTLSFISTHVCHVCSFQSGRNFSLKQNI
jgi:hypothetical protein